MYHLINMICYTICVVSIVGGVFLSLMLIWSECCQEDAFKMFLTLGVFFLGSLATLAVNRSVKTLFHKDDADEEG